MTLTDLNHRDVLPRMTDAAIASVAEDMPKREWMRKEMQSRVKARPYLADLFFNYLTK